MATTDTITSNQITIKLTAIDIVNIRKEADQTSTVIGIIQIGELATASKIVNDYYYLTFNGISGYALKKYFNADGALAVPVYNTVIGENDDTKNYKQTNTIDAEELLTTNMHGIFGMPYQFMPSVDRRLSGTSFGRKYAEKIVGRMPLLFLTPGHQSFMSEFKKEEKNNILTSLSVKEEDLDPNILVKGKGRYYTFKFDYAEYFNYVNPMCQNVAKLLGIGKTKINIGGYNAKLESYDWSKTLNDNFAGYFGTAQYLAFYMDANASVSESFGNNTTESSLVSQVNSMGQQAKEIQFLLGGLNNGKYLSSLTEESTGVLSSIKTTIDKATSGSGILSNLVDGASTVLSGGKLLFPELWSDSDYSLPAAEASFKFRSPDKDDLSVYLNCIVPYIHLLCMTCPRQIDANSVSAPFLVRGFFRGAWNVDMGVIQNLSVERGKEGSWNESGLPTEINVSITIKDLYSALGITSGRKASDFVQNTALMDYICNLAGINLAEPELTRQAKIWLNLQKNKFVNFPQRTFNGIEQGVANLLQKIF